MAKSAIWSASPSIHLENCHTLSQNFLLVRSSFGHVEKSLQGGRGHHDMAIGLGVAAAGKMGEEWRLRRGKRVRTDAAKGGGMAYIPVNGCTPVGNRVGFGAHR